MNNRELKLAISCLMFCLLVISCYGSAKIEVTDGIHFAKSKIDGKINDNTAEQKMLGIVYRNSRANNIYVWDYENNKYDKLTDTNIYFYPTISWGPENLILFKTSGTIKGSRESIGIIDLNTGDITAIAIGSYPNWTNSGTGIFYLSGQNELILYDISTKETQNLGKVAEGRFKDLIVNPINNTIAYLLEVNKEDNLIILDYEKMESTKPIYTERVIWDLFAWSPDGNWVILSTDSLGIIALNVYSKCYTSSDEIDSVIEYYNHATSIDWTNAGLTISGYLDNKPGIYWVDSRSETYKQWLADLTCPEN